MATALITGASSGIGEEFAYALARRQMELILVARREERLNQVAEQALKLGAPAVQVIAADLAHCEGPTRVFEETERRGLAVDWLVNNAGFGTAGAFESLDLQRELQEISLNVSALVALSRLFLTGMVRRKSGVIINVSSTASFQPMPYMATYAASKAFVTSFSLALATELRGSGVHVMALCPGPTRTEFQARAGIDDRRFGPLGMMDSRSVVERALRAVNRRRPICITGALNRVTAHLARHSPQTLVTRVAGSIFRPSTRPS